MSGTPTSPEDSASTPLPDIAALIERIDDGIIIFDELLNVRYANRRGAELFALAREQAPVPQDLVGRNLLADFPELQGSGWAHACRDARESGTAHISEHYSVPHARWYEFRIYPSGRELVVCTAEITDRKMLEATLEVRAERYRNLVETAHDLIWSVDASGRITFINGAAREIYGYEPEELIGRDFRDLIAPDHLARQAALFSEPPAQDDRYVIQEEVEVMHRSGERRILLANAVRLFDEGGIPAGTMGTSVDITARKRTEAALKSTESLLQTILANVPITIFATDIEGRFTFSEGQGLTRAGLAQSQHVGTSSLDLYADLEVLLDSGEVISGREAIHRALGGETLKGFAEVYGAHYESRIGPLRSAAGEITGIVGVSSDVTDRVRAGQEISQANENLRALSNRMRELQEAERRAITAELHDRIGQNLTGLGIRLQRLNGMLPDDQKAVLAGEFDLLQALVRDTTRHVRDIMADLLPPELEDHGLAAALETFAERAVAAGGPDLETDLPDLPSPPLPTDFALVLFRAAQEVVHNALKHAGATRLSLRLSEEAGTIRLEVADDGRGFDPDAPPANGSLAWGLKILRERIASIDGDLAIESRPGEGTRVTIKARRPA